MPAPHARRIVRRAVIALAVVVLLGLGLAWVATRESREIERSRALRIGMTRAEVEAVMGKQDGSWGVGRPLPAGFAGVGGDITNGASFGKSIVLKLRVFNWLGIKPKVRDNDWPVRVRFSDDDYVDLIIRDGEPKDEATH